MSIGTLSRKIIFTKLNIVCEYSNQTVMVKESTQTCAYESCIQPIHSMRLWSSKCYGSIDLCLGLVNVSTNFLLLQHASGQGSSSAAWLASQPVLVRIFKSFLSFLLGSDNNLLVLLCTEYKLL